MRIITTLPIVAIIIITSIRGTWTIISLSLSPSIVAIIINTTMMIRVITRIMIVVTWWHATSHISVRHGIPAHVLVRIYTIVIRVMVVIRSVYTTAHVDSMPASLPTVHVVVGIIGVVGIIVTSAVMYGVRGSSSHERGVVGWLRVHDGGHGDERSIGGAGVPRLGGMVLRRSRRQQRCQSLSVTFIEQWRTAATVMLGGRAVGRTCVCTDTSTGAAATLLLRLRLTTVLL